jgi:hypothetical protein
MKKLLITSGIILFFISCNKKDENSYSGIFDSKSIQISAVRLFTKNGEIKDINTIQHFINNSDVDYFILKTDSIIDVANKLMIEFSSNDKANFTYLDNMEVRNVKVKSDITYFESENISRTFNSNGESFDKKIITYFPLYSKDTIVPGPSGILSRIDFKHCYYANGNSSEIKFPLMSYLYVRHLTGDYFSKEAISDLNNAFNENSVTFLNDNDTLAIQQLSLILRK